MIKDLFQAHPASVNETYIEHLKAALFFACNLLIAAIVVTVHAFLPFLFEKTASDIIHKLYDKMTLSRNGFKKVGSVKHG